MSREQKIAKQLRAKGAITPDGEFKTKIEFKRNPGLDRVAIPHVGRKGATSVSVDSLIALTMEEMLGSRLAYIYWVRKAVNYIILQSQDQVGSAGLSRLVQREAVSFIKENSAKKVKEEINA